MSQTDSDLKAHTTHNTKNPNQEPLLPAQGCCSVSRLPLDLALSENTVRILSYCVYFPAEKPDRGEIPLQMTGCSGSVPCSGLGMGAGARLRMVESGL